MYGKMVAGAWLGLATVAVDASGTFLRNRKDRASDARPPNVHLDYWKQLKRGEQKATAGQPGSSDAVAGETAKHLKTYPIKYREYRGSDRPPAMAPAAAAVAVPYTHLTLPTIAAV